MENRIEITVLIKKDSGEPRYRLTGFCKRAFELYPTVNGLIDKALENVKKHEGGLNISYSQAYCEMLNSEVTIKGTDGEYSYPYCYVPKDKRTDTGLSNEAKELRRVLHRDDRDNDALPSRTSLIYHVAKISDCKPIVDKIIEEQKTAEPCSQGTFGTAKLTVIKNSVPDTVGGLSELVVNFIKRHCLTVLEFCYYANEVLQEGNL